MASLGGYVMDDETQARLIREKCMTGDFEEDHCNADEILGDTLIALGFRKTVDAWAEVGKWYA